jgi:protein-S-isoprenylcysteine O-methyltransferase Ste14
MSTRRQLPPTYFGVAFLLMIGLHFLVPLVEVIGSPFNYLGVLPILTGVLINIWCDNFFKKVNTTIKPFQVSSYLVTEGPFKYSRNPMYLGVVLILTGVFIFLGTLTPLLVIPAFVWIITKKFVVIEERALEGKFGDAYLEYTKRVRRWI